MIQAQFGLPDIALRTLELYTTATLEATLAPAPPPPDRWRRAMDSLAARRAGRLPDRRCTTSRASCRTSGRRHRRSELGAMPIGSRPARRTASGGVETLRAIPWVFAWTQTRLLLPDVAGHRRGAAWQRSATANATSSGSCIASGRSSAPPSTSSRWSSRRRTAGLPPNTTVSWCRRSSRRSARTSAIVSNEAIAAVLEVTGRKELLADNGVLQAARSTVRNPYVDPINLVQIELLRRLRRDGDQASYEVWTAFMITVNGIAAGMRNTG